MDVLEELLGSPYPSAAAVLLQLLRELVAATSPPPRRALDMAADWLEVRSTFWSLAGHMSPERGRLPQANNNLVCHAGGGIANSVWHAIMPPQRARERQTLGVLWMRRSVTATVTR